MPLNKSRTRAAFQENVKTEIAAGKPPRQAVAIAYATQGESKPSKHLKEHAHHSAHSAARSRHYHETVIAPTPSVIGRGATRMTRTEHQLDNAEDVTSKFSATNRARKP